MNEQAHTPGPWYWDEYGQLSSKHGWPVIAAGINKAGGAYVAVNQEDKLVLAAAPELLEALTDFIARWDALTGDVLRGVDQWCDDPHELCSDLVKDGMPHKARAAIAKATGEAS